MSKVSFIYLSQEEVKKSGGMDMIKAISDVEKVLVMRHKGECIVPHKVVLRTGKNGYSLTLWAWGSKTS